MISFITIKSGRNSVQPLSSKVLIVASSGHYRGLLIDIVHKQILAPFRTIFGVMTEQHVVEAEPEQLLRREQRHACLLGCAVALALVALDAGGHKVLRRRLAALGTREDVVKRQ